MMNKNVVMLVTCVTIGAACGSEDAEAGAGATVASLRRVECPPNKDFTCTDSAFWGSAADSFGKESFPVDADGCMRRQCRKDSDCSANETCFAPGCYPPGLSCQDTVSEAGETYCGCTGDPACHGAYCRPNM
jgi:hypothetical protein